MDRIAEWRPVEPAAPGGAADQDPAGEAEISSVRGAEPPPTAVAPVIALFMVAVLFGVGAVAVLLLSGMPSPTAAIDSNASAIPAASAVTAGAPAAAPEQAATIVVDVQGAVENPGPWRVPVGSRVGDAVEAAGGYSPQVDIAAASQQLNLAQTVSDGQKIHVPMRGESTVTAQQSPAGGGPAAGGGGLIDINTATAEQLDTLPGIGPVTAAKVIAAREEAPFTSVDELLGRGVVSQSVFDKIRALVTVTP